MRFGVNKECFNSDIAGEHVGFANNASEIKHQHGLKQNQSGHREGRLPTCFRPFQLLIDCFVRVMFASVEGSEPRDIYIGRLALLPFFALAYTGGA